MITEDILVVLQNKIEKRTVQFHKASRYLADLNAFASSRTGTLADRLYANFETARDRLTRSRQELQNLLSSEDARRLTGFSDGQN